MKHPLWFLAICLLCAAFAFQQARHISARYVPIHRSASQRRAFERSHPCPSTGRTYGACPGYIVDHIQPLACGGDDLPRNMQWQTITAAKAKDRIERVGCNE